MEITPQAGDLWKNDKSPYVYFIYKRHETNMIDCEGNVTSVPDIEDGKNGWELCYRPGWQKLIENNWPLDSKRYSWVETFG